LIPILDGGFIVKSFEQMLAMLLTLHILDLDILKLCVANLAAELTIIWVCVRPLIHIKVNSSV
jgi:hypothetical protein